MIRFGPKRVVYQTVVLFSVMLLVFKFLFCLNVIDSAQHITGNILYAERQNTEV